MKKSRRVRMYCPACKHTFKLKRTKVERRQLSPLKHHGCPSLGNRGLQCLPG